MMPTEDHGEIEATPKACKIVGPYFPVGEVDWHCRTHGVVAVLVDPSRWGAADIRRAELKCPMGES